LKCKQLVRRIKRKALELIISLSEPDDEDLVPPTSAAKRDSKKKTAAGQGD
jgi:hypothetical protein